MRKGSDLQILLCVVIALFVGFSLAGCSGGKSAFTSPTQDAAQPVSGSLLPSGGTPSSSLSVSKVGEGGGQPSSLLQRLEEATPFVNMSPDQKMLSLDTRAATVLSKETLALAQSIIEVNNELASGRLSIDTETEGGNTSAVKASHTWLHFFSQIADDKPPRRESNIYFNSTQEIGDYLKRNWGYHLTARYATTRDTYGRDWTDEYDYIGKPERLRVAKHNSVAYRFQSLGYQKNGRWTYWYEGPEPNPEVFSYFPPAWWWRPYVLWWHRTH